MDARMIIMDGPGIGNTFELAEKPDNIRIGRNQKFEIYIDDPLVGKKNALVQRRKEGYFVIPSSLEVSVNGELVKKDRLLMHGDMLVLKSTMMLYDEEMLYGEENEVSSDDNPKARIEDHKQPRNMDELLEIINNNTIDATRNLGIILKYMEICQKTATNGEVSKFLAESLDLLFEELPVDEGTILLRKPGTDEFLPVASKKRKV